MKNLLKEAEKITFKVDKNMDTRDNARIAAKKTAAMNELLKGIELPQTPRAKK